MKIGIVCTPRREGEAQLFRELLADKSLAVDLWRVSPDWSFQIEEWLAASTHFMLLVEPEEYEAPWFQYLCGFSAGRERPLLIVSNENLPRHLLTTPTADSDNAVLDYWLETSRIWEEARIIDEAKAALERAELPFTRETFCRCVSEGEFKAVELFFQAGMGGDAADKRGVPALSLAVREAHRTLISPLLTHGARIDAVSADRGNTALMDAAANGDLETVRDLIRAGADLNRRSKNGQTALILAVGKGSVDVAALLIEAGADHSVADSLGMSAYAYAKLFKQQRILDLIDAGNGEA